MTKGEAITEIVFYAVILVVVVIFSLIRVTKGPRPPGGKT